MPLLWLLLLLLTGVSRAAGPGGWPEAVVKVERWPAGNDAADFSAAICVAPGLLGTILKETARTDSFRAVAAGSIVPVKLLAHDTDSGFALLEAATAEPVPWRVMPLETAPLTAGLPLTVQATVPGTARYAGRQILYQSRLQECPWLRIHLPPGRWIPGTPLTDEGDRLAGLLEEEINGDTEAARMLPAAAVAHFVKQWTARRTFARAVIGIRLSPASAIPRVEECIAAGPAERAGVQPGDVLLRMGTREITDASTAAEACFYLAADEPVALSVLRGTGLVDLRVTPVSAAAPAGTKKP